MAEAAAIRDAVRPDQILMVVDAMTGQDAVNVAAAFAEKVDFDGVIMSKLDGDARGGAALSIRQVTGKPIKFASRRARSPTRSSCSTPTGWRSASSAWATSSRSSRRRRRSAPPRWTPKPRSACEARGLHARRLPRPDHAGAQDGRARGAS